MGNLEALPDEVQFAEPFHMSDAPLNAVERIKADRQALIEQKGVRVGARVRLLSDSSRCGVVESLAGSGRYAVRFADRVCNFYLTNLIALPEEVVPSHFLLQKAPPPPFVLTTAPMSNEELRLERSFRKKRGVHAGDRVGLVSDSRVRGVVEVALGGGWFSVRFSNKSRILSKNQLDVLPSYDPTFKHSKAPPNKAEDMRKSKRTKKRADDRAIEEKRLNLVSL
ncbi:hypothetical protein M885DRAFT_542509 [Pelagophyceae sp. CCMP2097]|nr:hypothetical protein M885DRAFT_542509 [Pelagophyceae sp. CCMP2097]